MSELKRVQLSSVGLVPLTDETRKKLIELGVTTEETFAQTEIWGRSILTLRMPQRKIRSDQAPACYWREYDPSSDLCTGCTWMPSCWRSTSSYLDELKAGEASPPPGVPKHVVEARLGRMALRSPPPKKSKALPKKTNKRKPPPRRRK